MVQGIKDHYPDMQLCPMIDARRMEVYCAVYSSFQATSLVAKVINKDSFKKNYLRDQFYFLAMVQINVNLYYHILMPSLNWEFIHQHQI